MNPTCPQCIGPRPHEAQGHKAAAAVSSKHQYAQEANAVTMRQAAQEAVTSHTRSLPDTHGVDILLGVVMRYQLLYSL